jgi:hypothetical protein
MGNQDKDANVCRPAQPRHRGACRYLPTVGMRQHGERHACGGDARRLVATGPPSSGCSSSLRVHHVPREGAIEYRPQDSNLQLTSSVPTAHCSSFGQCCVDSLPEKPGTTEPGPAELSTPTSFTLVRTCVPASPPLLVESSARIRACSCRIFPGCSHS